MRQVLTKLKTSAVPKRPLYVDIYGRPVDSKGEPIDSEGKPLDIKWRLLHYISTRGDIPSSLNAIVVILSDLTKNYRVVLPQCPAVFIADRFSQKTVTSVKSIEEVKNKIQSFGNLFKGYLGRQDSEEEARREALLGFVLPPPRDAGTPFNRVANP